jgi:uncharacterized membrane protein (DUF2068 family)
MAGPQHSSLRRVIPRDRWLALIAVLKFVKAATLVAVAFGAMELLRPEVAQQAQEWFGGLALSTDQVVVQRVLAWIVGLNQRKLELLGLAALLYATLFTIEGVGLWKARRWAEYLTVVATGSLVPFEAYELARRITPIRAAGLALNLAVVGYLIYRLRHPLRAAA